MPDKKRDPEIEALQSVHAALKPLSAEERYRILASVYALLGITGPDVAAGASSTSRPAPPPAADAPSANIPSRSQFKPLTITGLVQEKSPGTKAQWITLFAYYRDRREGNSRFAREDLKGYFAEVNEPPPRNYDRDFVEAVKRGWIHEDGADSYVTSKGIEAVESGFAGERKYTKRAGRPRKGGTSKPTKKPKAIRQRMTRGGRK